jgi:hypothetical protein
MRISKAAAAFVAAAMAASTAPARAAVEQDFAAETVGQLAAVCAVRATDPMAAGMCYGFIEGAGQFYNLMIADKRFEVANVVCADRELTREEIAAFLVDWVAGAPDRPALNPVVALVKMGAEQFPCPK